MGNRRWKKKGNGSRRKNAEFSTLDQNVDRQSSSSVPSWEKRFCSQVKWRDFCCNKRFLYLFPKVLAWDDSAGKEAFDNAKARFWAETNNLPSEIPLPDPNMYIQEVDHGAEDLSVHSSSAPFRSRTGWGDGDDQSSRIGVAAEPITTIPAGWDDEDSTEEKVETMLGTAEDHCGGDDRSSSSSLMRHLQSYYKERWIKRCNEALDFWRQKPFFKGILDNRRMISKT